VSAPIFISYSSKDQDIAETIYQALEARGLDCWIACRDVRPGENFQEAIVKALRSAKVMLLVFTSNANNSDEIKKELVLAGRHRVTVVPVRVEDVVPNDAFTYEFATRQWFDLFKNWEREIEQLATQLGHVLQTAKPLEDGGAGAAAAAQPPRRVAGRSSKQPLLWGAALAAVLILGGGAVLYMRPFARTAPAAPPPASQMAAQTPPAPTPVAPTATPAPSPPPPAPAVQPAPLPEPPAASQPSPDDAAWQNANAAATRASFGGYLKDFAAGVHVQEAKLRIADLILNAPATAKTFDGTWQTTWTCPDLGQYPGYSYRFAAQVKDGAYHGLKGVKGEPSSMVLDGKIEADGAAAFFGEIIVGSSVVALGAPRGTPSDFHALAQFERTAGNGKRIEGRPCILAFEKQ
jgi:hypothetical protein